MATMTIICDTQQLRPARGAPYRLVIESAIAIARPAGEDWSVMLREHVGGLPEMDFRHPAGHGGAALARIRRRR